MYGLNAARFLAALDEPDLLVLSLYGHLAAAMTRDTFIGGEAASLSPIGRAYYRSMYLPPNSVANAAWLETLRLLVVNELPDGRGLQLAYSTPRAWLRARQAHHRQPAADGVRAALVHARLARPLGERDDRRPADRRHHLSLRLRLPGGAHIASVTVGGRPLRTFDRATGTIDLTGHGSSLAVEVAVAR